MLIPFHPIPRKSSFLFNFLMDFDTLMTSFGRWFMLLVEHSSGTLIITFSPLTNFQPTITFFLLSLIFAFSLCLQDLHFFTTSNSPIYPLTTLTSSNMHRNNLNSSKHKPFVSLKHLHLSEDSFDGDAPGYSLICKVLNEHHRYFLKEFTKAVQRIWNPQGTKTILIRWTGVKNLFIAKFLDIIDYNDAKLRSPWFIIGGVLILIQNWNPNLAPELHDFTWQKFVISMHLRKDLHRGNIPKVIDSEIGEVQSIIQVDDEYFEATVLINVHKTLYTKIRVTLFDKDHYAVWLHYYKFPYAICKECFILDHCRASCRLNAGANKDGEVPHLFFQSDNSHSVPRIGWKPSSGSSQMAGSSSNSGPQHIRDMFHSDLGDVFRRERRGKRVRFEEIEDRGSSIIPSPIQPPTRPTQFPNNLPHTSIESSYWQWKGIVSTPGNIQSLVPQYSNSTSLLDLHSEVDIDTQSHQNSIIKSTLDLAIEDSEGDSLQASQTQETS